MGENTNGTGIERRQKKSNKRKSFCKEDVRMQICEDHAGVVA